MSNKNKTEYEYGAASRRRDVIKKSVVWGFMVLVIGTLVLSMSPTPQGLIPQQSPQEQQVIPQ